MLVKSGTCKGVFHPTSTFILNLFEDFFTSMFTFFQGTLLCALATNFEIVLASRILLGHAGASSMAAVPLYTSEISQPEVRTITGCFNVACTTLGVAISLLLGRYL